MKRLLSFVLLILIMLLLASCATPAVTPKVQTTYDPNGNMIILSDSGNTLMASKLPAAIDYNGNSVYLSNVTAYQDQVGYAYRLFVLIRVVANTLDAAQFHWLKTEDIDVKPYLTHKKNGYDFDRLLRVGLLYDEAEKALYYVFKSSDYKDNRYAFDDVEITTSICIKQEETYPYTSEDGEQSTLNKEESMQYSTFFTSEDILPSDAMRNPSFAQVQEWMGEP